MSGKDIAIMVGEETNRFELDNGVVLIYRNPTTREYVKFKNSVKVRRSGKDVQVKSTEEELAFADRLIVDIEAVGYKGQDGKTKRLSAKTTAADIAHLKVDGAPPESWKDLVPAHLKSQFVNSLLAGIEEEDRD